ncbi:hypothetical protein K7X08_012345 [Anisodus acutangulus]|uniref:Uncharacterized protein n=1 Tax=Anisodus acutangulus TaxID=402998 RepID=A0A9Q1LB70_9SOLA|nr:hypothetical protein K7X08_012345 [Anisodus acutangulus]
MKFLALHGGAGTPEIHSWGGKQAWRFSRNVSCPTEIVVLQFEVLLLVASAGLTYLHVLVVPAALAAAKANLLVIDQRKNFSVVKAFSRAFPIPSVSGPVLQICGYHTDLLISEHTQGSLDINCQEAAMAICSSRTSPSVACFSSKMTSRNHTPGARYFLKLIDSPIHNLAHFNSLHSSVSKVKCSITVSSFSAGQFPPRNTGKFCDCIWYLPHRKGLPENKPSKLRRRKRNIVVTTHNV